MTSPTEAELVAAQELRDGPVKLPGAGLSLDVLKATATSSILLDFAAVRVNPQKAAARAYKINLVLTHRNAIVLLSIGNGVLVHETGVRAESAGLTLRMKRHELLLTLFAGVPFALRAASGEIEVEGDASLYNNFIGLIEPLSPNFPIVTP